MAIINRSALRADNGLPFFEAPEIARIPWVRHGFLTRKGGVSPPPYDTLNMGGAGGDLSGNLSRNGNRIAETFRFDRNRLILLNQRHGDGILLLKEPMHAIAPPLEYDALMTNVPNLFLGILTADCLPILVVDPRRKAIGAIHAGRSGTALRITSKCLKTMTDEFGSSVGDLRIAIGPSIGSCCYEIDRHVFQGDWEPFSASAGEGR
ncbi:MAG: laccase domain-containing protein, partial [Deltaproteobacteria bacterium]